MPRPRSYLYVPGDQSKKLERAHTRGADAIIVDLEDSVIPERRPAARLLMSDWLAGIGQRFQGEVWIRVNAGLADFQEDISAVVGSAVCGVVVPKASGLDHLETVDRALAHAEGRLGLPCGAFKIAALLESAKGLVNCESIGHHHRLSHFGIGEYDLREDLKIPKLASEEVLDSVRLRVVMASALCGIHQPVGSASPDFTDLERFRSSTVRLALLGFGGRSAIHPNQVEIINVVFDEASQEREWAMEVLARASQENARGSGAFLGPGGEMVDEAMIRRARRILETYPNSGTSRDAAEG